MRTDHERYKKYEVVQWYGFSEKKPMDKKFKPVKDFWIEKTFDNKYECFCAKIYVDDVLQFIQIPYYLPIERNKVNGKTVYKRNGDDIDLSSTLKLKEVESFDTEQYNELKKVINADNKYRSVSLEKHEMEGGWYLDDFYDSYLVNDFNVLLGHKILNENESTVCFIIETSEYKMNVLLYGIRKLKFSKFTLSIYKDSLPSDDQKQDITDLKIWINLENKMNNKVVKFFGEDEDIHSDWDYSHFYRYRCF